MFSVWGAATGRPQPARAGGDLTYCNGSLYERPLYLPLCDGRPSRDRLVTLWYFHKSLSTTYVGYFEQPGISGFSIWPVIPTKLFQIQNLCIRNNAVFTPADRRTGDGVAAHPGYEPRYLWYILTCSLAANFASQDNGVMDSVIGRYSWWTALKSCIYYTVRRGNPHKIPVL